MAYRSVATTIWTDDTILSMSPEQKLLFLYLHTSPYSSACGIFKLQFRTMSFQVGLMGDPFESALRGLCAAFPDFVAVDWKTGEVALLQYPRQTLIDMSPGQGGKLYAHIRKEVEKVESQYLLRELIARNSATLSAAYLEQLRRLQMRVINAGKIEADVVDDVEVVLYGDVVQVVEDEDDDRKRETKHKQETKEKESAREDFSEPPVKEKLTVQIPDTPDWKEVAKAMYAHTLNGGKDDWEFLKEGTGYTGDGRDIFTNWAGKANAYQLRNWEDEFRKLGTWMKNEARADFKAKPKTQSQPDPPKRRATSPPQPERERMTPEQALALREKYAVK